MTAGATATYLTIHHVLVEIEVGVVVVSFNEFMNIKRRSHGLWLGNKIMDLADRGV